MDQTKYQILQAWNLYLGGPKEWNVQRAIDEGAPEDAIYKDHGGNWIQMVELGADHPFHDYYGLVRERGFL
jgi:hypothetical protein